MFKEVIITEFFRNCPQCEKVLYYKNKYTLKRSVDDNLSCASCCRKGRILSDERKEQIRQSMMGEKNHFYGKKHTDETKKKLRDNGYHPIWSEEMKQKASESRKGKKYLTPEQYKELGERRRGRIISEETREKMKNRIFTDEWRKNIGLSSKGRKCTEENKERLRKHYQELRIQKYGSEELVPKWTRRQLGWWAFQVKQRDKEICQICLVTDTQFNAHHIFPKAEHPSIALNINNGITLCVNCHDFVHEFLDLKSKLNG